MAYWVLSPISGASHRSVGFAFILSHRVLAPWTPSSSERAGKIPSVPFKPAAERALINEITSRVVVFTGDLHVEGQKGEQIDDADASEKQKTRVCYGLLHVMAAHTADRRKEDETTS